MYDPRQVVMAIAVFSLAACEREPSKQQLMAQCRSSHMYAGSSILDDFPDCMVQHEYYLMTNRSCMKMDDARHPVGPTARALRDQNCWDKIYTNYP
jgi:hypothetical protein